MTVRARGANAAMILAFEDAYGVAPAIGAYVKTPFVSSTLGLEQQLIDNDVLGNGRNPYDPVYDTKKNAGDVTVPADTRNTGYWLKLLCGAPTTAAHDAATGKYTFSAQPAVNSTITIGGTVWTFVAAGAAGPQSNIGVSLAATLTALAIALNASADVQTAKATYVATATTLNISFDTLGLTGNAFTIAASGTSNAKPSAATLLGGTNGHTFKMGAQNLPSASVEVGLPDVGSFGLNTGVRANMAKIAMATSGLLNLVMSLIAQNEVRATATIDDTPDTLDSVRFTQFSGEVDVDGVQVGQIVSADVTLSNNFETIEVIRPDGLIEDADPGIVGASGQLVTRFATVDMLDRATSATPCALKLAWAGAFSAALSITIHRTFLPKSKVPVAGPQGIQITFPYKASYDATAQTTATVVLVNDVAAY